MLKPLSVELEPVVFSIYMTLIRRVEKHVVKRLLDVDVRVATTIANALFMTLVGCVSASTHAIAPLEARGEAARCGTSSKSSTHSVSR